MQIEEVRDARARRAFVRWPRALYRDCPFAALPLERDELAVLTPGRTPLWDRAEARLWLARKGGAIVGRVAAVRSELAIVGTGRAALRFGWFDCTDDDDVARALFEAVFAWARTLGLAEVTGPLGFTGLDRGGLLVEGFDRLPSLAGDYHPPHHARLLDALGFQKEVDTIELALRGFPLVGPHRILALASEVARRRGYRLVEPRTRAELRRHAPAILALFERTYAELHGAFPLTAAQRAHYTDAFFPYLDPRFAKLLFDRHDQAIAFFLAVPRVAEGLARARGRLLPLGLWHLLRARRRSRTLELVLGGIDPRHRGLGADLVLGEAMNASALAHGFHGAEVYPQLETNRRVLGAWSVFDPAPIRRRRLYRRAI